MAKLLPDWKRVLRHAWSIRLILLAGLLSGLEVAQPLVADILPIPPLTFAILAMMVTAAAFVARLMAQKSLTEPRNTSPEDLEFEP
ncbi:DUF7940 domain-containing protein [Paradevosia shaoguanensis]|uniref:Uncharacterized protein n=1 Tax=Paradevosia shaoguanensis TaxID=1335043 RepID=A0AA41QIQ0_9HYPH|nr:hypothetical protein [Paradevosia shaoguanensis]MCF1740714.1 hypothetical protein [Paradevosia shaoguanensis]MCI0125198.1 hypothetical protein [Paradevosia shaoguanensis]